MCDTDSQSSSFKQMAFIRDGWHSKDCLFIVDPSGIITKRRCSKCANVHSNIRPSRFPELFREKAQDPDLSAPTIVVANVTLEPKQGSVSVAELMFSDSRALRKHILSHVDLIGDRNDLSTDVDLLLLQKLSN